MSKINRHPVRRTAAGVLAGALTLSGVVAAATPAAAAPTFGLERIAGEGRYETSAAIARAFIAANSGAVTNVILASGENTNTPDALAASFLAGVQNAPVVLTQRSTTPGATRDVLATLRTQGAANLTVVGGTAAVAEEQVTALRALGWTVTRVGGANRYETAANIATAGEAGGVNGAASNVGLLASGTSTIDALAGGPVAFKGRHPLFLTTRDGVPGATLRSMQANGVTSVYILGGEAVVSARVVAQLRDANITVVDRLAGADRSATSVAIARAVIGGTFGFTSTTFNVASGINNGVDALGGAALSGKQNRVLLITNVAGSAAPIEAFASANVASLTAVGTIFGGTGVVTEALEARIETAAGGRANVGGSATIRPELVTAAIVETVTAGNATPTRLAGTYVRYTFDEPVGSVAANVAANFKIYNADGSVAGVGDATSTEAGGTSVVVRFDEIQVASGTTNLTLATVLPAAVTDATGNTNPEGDAAIGGGSSTTLTSGVTSAPDLLSVGRFAQGASVGTTVVDFTFDEPATVLGTGGFSLVLQDNSTAPCAVSTTPSSTAPSGGTVAGGSGTAVITAVCTNPNITGANPGGTPLSTTTVARGVVAAMSVNDTSASTVPNATQTADAGNGGNTSGPDLVSATVTQGGTGEVDQVLYVFDANVTATNVDETLFGAYTSSGAVVTAAADATVIISTTDARQVRVNFPSNNALNNAVGAFVGAGAVTAGSSGQNQVDEVGVSNANATTVTPGRTAAPDLIGVQIVPSTGFSAALIRYTFDENVDDAADIVEAQFGAYTSNGARLTGPANCARGTSATTDSATAGAVVTCAFDGVANGTVENVILGTVLAGAVQGDNGGIDNPEGAEVATGGTGTRAS